MAITFACPECGKQLRVSDDKAGKKAKCPACATVMMIPDAPESEEVEEESVRSAPAKVKARVSAPRQAPPGREEEEERRPRPRRESPPPEDTEDEPPPGDEDEPTFKPKKKKKKKKKKAGSGLAFWLIAGAGGLLVVGGLTVAALWFFVWSGGLGSEMNYVPDDAVSISSENQEKARSSSFYKKVLKEVPEAEKLSGAFGKREDLGLASEDIVRITHASSKDNGHITMIRTKKALKAEDIKSKKEKVKFTETKVGSHTLYAGENEHSEAFAIPESKLIVLGQKKHLEAVLKRGGKPQLSDDMKMLLGKVSFSNASASVGTGGLFGGKTEGVVGTVMEGSVSSSLKISITTYCKDPEAAKKLKEKMDEDQSKFGSGGSDGPFGTPKVSVSGSKLTMTMSATADKYIEHLKNLQERLGARPGLPPQGGGQVPPPEGEQPPPEQPKPKPPGSKPPAPKPQPPKPGSRPGPMPPPGDGAPLLPPGPGGERPQPLPIPAGPGLPRPPAPGT